MEKQKSDTTQQKTPKTPKTEVYFVFFNSISFIKINLKYFQADENNDLINIIKEYDYQQYIQLCRNKPLPYQNANLQCRYVTNNSPFLKIAPLKLEEYSIDPYLVIYHEVLYESEIEQLKIVSHSNVGYKPK